MESVLGSQGHPGRKVRALGTLKHKNWAGKRTLRPRRVASKVGGNPNTKPKQESFKGKRYELRDQPQARSSEKQLLLRQSNCFKAPRFNSKDNSHNFLRAYRCLAL